jgi:hypothetical protein
MQGEIQASRGRCAMNDRTLIWAIALVVASSMTACSTRELATGAVVGAGAYEYSNKRAMDDLDQDYRAGRITREEYERRKDQIESRSVVY